MIPNEQTRTKGINMTLSKEDLERKNNELSRMLLQTNKMSLLGEMSASVAHELRGSLSSISMAVDLLWKSTQEGKKLPKCENYYKTLREEIDASDKIIENLLSFSRKSMHKNESIDIELLIRDIISFKTKTMSLDSIKIKKSFLGLPKINANKESMKTIFFNLIGNAIQAMEKKGGLLEVKTRHETDFVTIEVADTGEGISKENSFRIWEPFYTTKGEKGTGIGLYVTKMEVERHGGKISLDNAREKGTSFLVNLPIYQEEIIKRKLF